jgi:hypothetical protein
MQYSQIVSRFIDEAIADVNSKNLHLFSRHLYELIDLPKSKSESITIYTDVYSELLNQYRKISDQYMAMLVISIADSKYLKYYEFIDLYSGNLELGTPAEVYLIKRYDANEEPYILEEYKRPIRSELVGLDKEVYAYYRSSRNEPDELFSCGFYFEHYPNFNVEHEWR